MTLSQAMTCAALLCFGPIAHAGGIYANLGYTALADKAGVEFEVGYQKTVGPVTVSFSPLSSVFLFDHRYRDTANAYGGSTCQDESGRGVDSSNCSVKEIDLAAALLGEVRLSDSISLGAGTRFSRSNQPFGTMRLKLADSSFLVKFGNNYFSANVAVVF